MLRLKRNRRKTLCPSSLESRKDFGVLLRRGNTQSGVTLHNDGEHEIIKQIQREVVKHPRAQGSGTENERTFSSFQFVSLPTPQSFNLNIFLYFAIKITLLIFNMITMNRKLARKLKTLQEEHDRNRTHGAGSFIGYSERRRGCLPVW